MLIKECEIDGESRLVDRLHRLESGEWVELSLASDTCTYFQKCLIDLDEVREYLRVRKLYSTTGKELSQAVRRKALDTGQDNIVVLARLLHEIDRIYKKVTKKSFYCHPAIDQIAILQDFSQLMTEEHNITIGDSNGREAINLYKIIYKKTGWFIY